jgi:hypothetical protein
MPGDQFILYDNGAWSDDLGVMALAGDGEAFTFGNQVIQDLMREAPPNVSAGPWPSITTGAPLSAFPLNWTPLRSDRETDDPRDLLAHPPRGHWS